MPIHFHQSEAFNAGTHTVFWLPWFDPALVLCIGALLTKSFLHTIPILFHLSPSSPLCGCVDAGEAARGELESQLEEAVEIAEREAGRAARVEERLQQVQAERDRLQEQLSQMGMRRDSGVGEDGETSGEGEINKGLRADRGGVRSQLLEADSRRESGAAGGMGRVSMDGREMSDLMEQLEVKCCCVACGTPRRVQRRSFVVITAGGTAWWSITLRCTSPPMCVSSSCVMRTSVYGYAIRRFAMRAMFVCIMCEMFLRFLVFVRIMYATFLRCS